VNNLAWPPYSACCTLLRDSLTYQIAEQRIKISSVKANIAKNDDRIQQILKLVVTA
jgi:hypothetical protein